MRLIVGLAAAAVILGTLVVMRHVIARVGIENAVRIFSSYDVSIGDVHIAHDAALFTDVSASRNGVPLIAVRRLEVRYSLRDLFPGSGRRFGLVAIDVSGATVTVVRFHDGSYNFTPPAHNASPITPPPRPERNNVPLRFSVRVRDSSLELREPAAYDRAARSIAIRGFHGDAEIDTSHRTHYAAGAAFAMDPPQPFTLSGTIDAIRGFALHRALAKRIPLRALANYFTDTPDVRILGGEARNFDARLYALDVEPNVTSGYHANMHLDVENGSVALSALAVPVKSLRGRVQLVDSTVFLRRMDAGLAGIPLHLAGGIYDLLGSITGRPQLRLGIYGSGELSALRDAFTFTRDQPISGPVQLGVLVEGALENPTIVAHAMSVRAYYRAVPFDDLKAGVVYRDGVVGLLPLRAYYGTTLVTVRGVLTTGKVLGSNVAVHIVGSGDRLPYLDELLGREPIVADAVATGENTDFDGGGVVASALGVRRVAALFALRPDGTAAIKPFWLHTQRGDFDGGYVLDRPHANSAFWALASNVAMQAPAHPAFPGLSLPSVPPIDGHVDRIAVAGTGSGAHIALAGEVAARETRIAGIDFYTLGAAFGGTLSNAQIGLLHASGPWGRFDGNGAFSSQALVAGGAYHGTLEGLQPFLTSAIPAHGPISGHAAIALASHRLIVQGDNLDMPGASLRGIPISRASLTIGVETHRLRVYSAHAHAANGDVVAAGTFSLANHSAAGDGGDALSLIVDRLDAAQLHSLGLPLDAGRIWAVGNLTAGSPLPTFDGGVTLADGIAARYPVSGGGEVRLAGEAADLRYVVGAIGPAYALVSGNIGALTSGSPAYALDATVPAAGVAQTVHALHVSPPYPLDGTFNAHVTLRGRSSDPSVNGSVNMPAGMVNGLPFVDAGAVVAADMHGGSARDGKVVVATTAAHFDAVAHGHETSIALAAPQATLGDFNNFFDTGDTLAGSGSVRLFAALYGGTRLSSDGVVDVRGLRYRNLPFGDTAGTWSSAGNDIGGSLAIGSERGMLRAGGSIHFVPSANLRSTLERSHYDLSGSIANLDLSLWVPALGFTSVPITGSGSAVATVRGTFPRLNLHGSAAIDDGTIGNVHLDTAKLALRSSGSRIAVESAEVRSLGLSATASGSFGLRPHDPLDVQVHATTSDVPRLVHQFTGKTIAVTGTFESTLRIGGFNSAPTLAAGLDASSVTAYGLAIPSLFGEVRLHGKTLELSNAGVTFAKGEATLAGFVPLRLSPLGLGYPGEAVRFDADVTDLDPAIFNDVLGHNTKMGGSINGHLGLSGTIGSPLILGHATLANGSYVSDVQRETISQARASLRFDHTSATFDDMYAHVGAGAISGSGRLQFPHGFGPAGGYSFDATAVAKGAQLDFPAYGNGTINGEVALTKTPASKSLLSGTVALSSATLALTAFLQGGGGGPSTLPPIPLALDLHASAGRGVRVRGRGYGAAMDVGLTGALHVMGTVGVPLLDGTITSTGGTVTYFDRSFRVTEGNVSFDGTGITPLIHAVATTNVFMPESAYARNGSVEVTVTASGQIDRLDVQFASNPPGYSTNQILAMLAPFGGFINYGTSGQVPGQVQTPGGFTPIGAAQPLPAGVYQTGNNSVTVGREAFNLLNARFSSALFGPLETALGEGLGLSSVNLTLGYYGNLGLTATRSLGDNFSAIYSATLGVPQVYTFGLRYNPSPFTSATLSFFYQTGATRVLAQPLNTIGNSGQLAGQPLFGTSGFDFLFQRYL